MLSFTPFEGEFVDDVARIAEGPCQAVELGNDERVASATRGKRDPQSRAFSIGASQAVIGVDVTGVDSKLRKSESLGGEILISCGHACVSD
ncbi:hypothetical protein GCM10027029_25600 [Conyzicola lurida]